VVQRHFFEKAQHRSEFLAEWRRPVIVQDLLDERLVLQRGRRDRGVSVRSKVAVIEA
jgi:hypothetical protein